jgi:hypothetical protein
MPKDIGRWRSPRVSATLQSALRVGGWSLTLAGLAYAGLWAFAPLKFADATGLIVLAGATLVTAAYGIRAAVVCRRTETTTTI